MEKRKKRKEAQKKASVIYYYFNTISVAVLNICKQEVKLNQKRNSKVSLKNFGYFGVIQ